MKEKLKALGGFIVGVAAMILIGVIVALFLRGSAWVSEKALPILTAIGAITIVPLILIGLPLSIFRKCRPVCAVIFVYWSYLCGLCLWMTSLLVTINLWGYIAAIIGLFMAGIDIPIAVIACMFKGEWSLFFQLILQFLFLFGARIYGFYLACKKRRKKKSLMYETRRKPRNGFRLVRRPSSAVERDPRQVQSASCPAWSRTRWHWRKRARQPNPWFRWRCVVGQNLISSKLSR